MILMSKNERYESEEVEHLQKKLGVMAGQVAEYDNFIDYLVDKLDGDREELMKEFLHGEEEW